MGAFSESSNVIWTIRKYVRRLRRLALDELAEDYELFLEDFVGKFISDAAKFVQS